MPDKQYLTSDLYNYALRVEDNDEFLQELLPQLTEQKVMWKEIINKIIEENHYTKSSLAKLCGVSHVTVSKWCNGSIPQSRELFIRIGFAAHYKTDEMNFFLRRYGRYPELYAKSSLEDSVCIFVLSSSSLKGTYEEYVEILERVKKRIVGDKEEEKYYETNAIIKQLLSMKTIKELEEYLNDNIGMYKQAFNKFYDYVEAFLLLNRQEYAMQYDAISINSLSNIQGWTSSLKHAVYDIHKREWFPLRSKVISLGIHLNMDVEEINKMLSLAKMETLCAKNPTESAIIYAVEDAALNDVSEVSEHVYKVLKELNLSDATDLIEELKMDEG